MSEPHILRGLRFFGQEGSHDLTFRDGLITAVTPAEGAGTLALPAFRDGHLHLFPGGVTLEQVNLAHIHDAEALRAALLPRASATPAGELICAYAANYDLLGAQRPDRHALDAILPDQPLCIAATDFHCAWANTAALRLAGILAGADAGPGSEVVMGPDGLATGELREFAAMNLVRNLGPSGGRESLALSGLEPEAVTQAQRARDKETLRRAIAECLRHGITSVVNMDGNLYLADLLSEMADEGLPLDISLPMTLVPGQSDERRRALLTCAGRAPVGRLSFGRVKMFMDGVFDTWTAFRTDDYPDRPGFRSAPLFTPEEFARNCIEADALGLSIATHAVGDGAVRAALDGYEAAIRTNRSRIRHQIEHIDMIHPDDLPRLAALGVTASMQPVHPPGLAGLPLEPTISIMSPERWGDTFAWKAIAAQGVKLVFGTDWPVSPLSPFHALHCALSRQPWSAGVLDQRIPLSAALAAYTEGRNLAPGAPADLILVEGDPAALAHDPQACRILRVISRGQQVWPPAI